MSDLSQSSKDPETLAIFSGAEESKTGNIDEKIKKEDNSDELDALGGGLQKLKLENEEPQKLRLEIAQLQRDLNEKNKQLENALARVEVARFVAVTLPPKIVQEESLIFYKLDENRGYVTRTRKENEKAAFNELKSRYPGISLIHRWDNVPNSKHLASKVKGMLPKNATRYNMIYFECELDELAIENIIEVANKDKIF